MKISLLVIHPDGGWDGTDEPEQFVVLRYSDGENKASMNWVTLKVSELISNAAPDSDVPVPE